jgi:hypothetical protein
MESKKEADLISHLWGGGRGEIQKEKGVRYVGFLLVERSLHCDICFFKLR